MTNTDGPYERKVQFTGGTTYTVSLPKAWATSHSIGIGDPVTLHTRGSRLIVTKPADSADRRTVTITGTQYGPSGLARVVTAPTSRTRDSRRPSEGTPGDRPR